jgi:cation:H+ antiporter
VPDATLALVFVVAALVSLVTSWVLVSRLERVGARLGLSEALLGMLAALAADAPEITAAVTALAGHQSRIGAGVVIGSNVFNLAALLGLAAVLAGRIALHRRVVLLEGVVALWVAGTCLVVVFGLISPAVGLAAGLAVLVPYLVVLGVRRDRLRRLGLPAAWLSWLTSAVEEEELELEAAIHPRRGRRADALVAGLAVVVVVGASVAMEQAAATLGAHHGVPQIVIGGLVLAAVTSLPNAVAASYLARRGRGAATLSTAMNSNALNVIAGFLLPATIVGLAESSGPATVAAAWYLALTAFALVMAYLARGLWRVHGALILSAYLAFAGVILSTAYSSRAGLVLSIVVPAVAALVVAVWLRGPAGRGGGPTSAEARPGDPDPALVEAIAAITRSSRMDVNGDHGADGKRPRLPQRPSSPDQSLLAGWSIKRVWYLALLITALIAAADAILGHHLILIGLLIAGPCCALLTGRWLPTVTAGAWAVALAVPLGVPDGIWGTFTHLVLLAAVVIVAAVSTSSAYVLEKRRS